MLGQSREHSWTDFVSIVERQFVIGPARAGKQNVRTSLPFDPPPNPLERGQHAPWLTCRPIAHPEQ